MDMNNDSFRFETLKIWQRTADSSSPLFKLADKLDERRYYRFAEQLRAATLSITNNIAEGSGSGSNADFANFINTARRSVFEVANMLILLSREGYLLKAEIDPLLLELVEQSKMLRSFRQTLKKM
jgi:four helix bundle protein